MNIGFLITARLKSTRLPNKIIMDLNGKTVIERIIDRAKNVHNISTIVICTSTHPQDRKLVDIAIKNNVYYFNGSEDDVLDRLLHAAELFELDYFVGITADNPLFSIHHSNLIVEQVQKNEYDFIKTNGLPLGSATYAIKKNALKVVCQVKNIIDTEIWGSLIDRPDIFNIKTIEVEKKYRKPEWRLTLDYEQDYQLMNAIYNHYKSDDVLHLLDVIQFLEAHEELLEINKNCIQRQLDERLQHKINQTFEQNLEKILEMKNQIYDT